MKVDSLKLITTKLITVMLLVGAYFALIRNEFQLSDLVTGAIISWVTLALNSEYSDQASTRNARQQQSAFDSGVQTTPTVTTTSGPPQTTTVSPSPAPPSPDEPKVPAPAPVPTPAPVPARPPLEGDAKG